MTGKIMACTNSSKMKACVLAAFVAESTAALKATSDEPPAVLAEPPVLIHVSLKDCLRMSHQVEKAGQCTLWKVSALTNTVTIGL
jgi:hypothetical protein